MNGNMVMSFLHRQALGRTSSLVSGCRRLRAETAKRPYSSASGLGRLLKVSEEVKDAVATDKPVVALESTIYTHGAFKDDLGLEAIVRSHGAIPAVCAVLDGVPTVGLTTAERDRLVDSGTAIKASRRDLAYAVGMVSPPWPPSASRN